MASINCGAGCRPGEAALLDGHTYALGRTVRLVLPDGAEATLKKDGAEIELEGPMDLRLR